MAKKKKDMKSGEPSSPSEKAGTLLPDSREDLVGDAANELHPEKQKEWPRIDDEHASSEESSMQSDISDDTQGSLIKRKFQAIAAKMKKKLELDRLSDQAYETLPDGARDISRETSSPELRKATTNSITGGGSEYTPREEWRSAIDAGSGLTYYYVKGTSTVTWEKPEGL